MNSGNLRYKCVANNSAGTKSSQDLLITVNGKANNDYMYIKKIGCVRFSLLFPVCLFLSVPFLPACRRLVATKEIGDVCRQASSLLAIVYHFLPGVSRANRVACSG